MRDFGKYTTIAALVFVGIILSAVSGGRARAAQAPEGKRSVMDGVYTAEQAKR